MLNPADRQLSPSEIESLTGIDAGHYVAQANKLKREGIKCFVDARKEVVVWLSWVQLAGISQVVIDAKPTTRTQAAKNDDIVLDFSALRKMKNGQAEKKQRR